MKAYLITFVFLLPSCAPHHVTNDFIAQPSKLVYKCVNYWRTIAICDTLEECNKICTQEANK